MKILSIYNHRFRFGETGLKAKVVIAVIVLSALSGCGGKGVDATLATKDEVTYRTSLNAAWKDMNEEQQQAFNWAVSNFSVDQLIAKYSNMTPRKVINREADEYIAYKTKELAKVTAELAQNAERLSREEAIVKDVQQELAKITVDSAAIVNPSHGFYKQIIFTTQNASRFNVSSAVWNAWVFVDGEAQSDRHCLIRTFYKVNGGLQAGKSAQYKTDVGFSDCRSWETLDVANAKSKRFKFELDQSSVEDFSEKDVLPTFSPVRADYQRKIDAAQKDMQVAIQAKATL